MKLKRKHEPEALAAWLAQFGHLPQASRPQSDVPVDHVEVGNVTHFWNVTPNLIDGGVLEGWLTIGNGRVTLKTHDSLDDIVYKIVRVPGHYCNHCNAALEDDGYGTQARKHIEEQHADAEASPDPSNPHGWRKDNFYRCELESGAVAKKSGNDPVKPSFLKRLLGN